MESSPLLLSSMAKIWGEKDVEEQVRSNKDVSKGRDKDIIHILLWQKDTQLYVYGVTMIWPPQLTDVSIKNYFC